MSKGLHVAPPHQKKPAEVVQPPDRFPLGAYRVRYSGYVPLEGDTGADPGHSGEITSLSCLGMPRCSPSYTGGGGWEEGGLGSSA